MSGIIHNFSVLAQGGGHVGVQTQNPVLIAQARPYHVVILVGIGQAVGRRETEEAVIIPEATVKHRRICPVSIEAQVGQTQINAVFGFVGQVYKALHIDAVFKVLVHPDFVFLG